MVEPRLIIDGKHMDPSELTIHTVMPRQLGPMDEWIDRLRVSSECEYNMVHFTPLQVAR